MQNPQRVLRLAEYFGKRIEENTADSRLVDIAVSKILQAKGQVQLPELLKTLAVSERSLERHLKQYIGINPNAYIRLCRFHAALQDVRNLSYDNLTGIAYAYGYADQSHFIREFKKFFRHLSAEIFKERSGGAERSSGFLLHGPVTFFLLSELFYFQSAYPPTFVLHSKGLNHLAGSREVRKSGPLSQTLQEEIRSVKTRHKMKIAIIGATAGVNPSQNKP